MERSARDGAHRGRKRRHRVALAWMTFLAAAGCGIHPVYLNRPAAAESGAGVTAARLPGEGPYIQTLRRFVDVDGRVDYRGIAKEPEQIDAYLQAMAGVRVEELDSDARKAFWLNAYNAAILRALTLFSPLRSPRDMPGLYRRTLLHVGAEELSLDEIVERKLLALGDARVIFALRTGCLGGPKVGRRIWRAENLDRELDAISRAFLEDRDLNRFDPAAKRVLLSPIFRWYRDVFASWRGGVRGFLAELFPGRAEWLMDAATRIEFNAWNWNVDARERRR